MTSTPDRDPSSPASEGPLTDADETAAQRKQRKADEADDAWAESEKKRHEDEIERRVQEEWRKPFG